MYLYIHIISVGTYDEILDISLVLGFPLQQDWQLINDYESMSNCSQGENKFIVILKMYVETTCFLVLSFLQPKSLGI